MWAKNFVTMIIELPAFILAIVKIFKEADFVS